MIADRLKYREYHRIDSNQYFWRTYDGSEVDLVEERESKLYGYEFKWKPRERPRVLAKWNEYIREVRIKLSPPVICKVLSYVKLKYETRYENSDGRFNQASAPKDTV